MENRLKSYRALDDLVALLARKKHIDETSARLHAVELLVEDCEPIDVFGEWEYQCWVNRQPDTLEGLDEQRAFEILTEHRDCVTVGPGYRDGRRTFPLAFDETSIRELIGRLNGKL